jgi:hypothetical protein
MTGSGADICIIGGAQKNIYLETMKSISTIEAKAASRIKMVFRVTNYLARS